MTLAHDDLRGWEAALLPKPQRLAESDTTTWCTFDVPYVQSRKAIFSSRSYRGVIMSINIIE